MADDNTPDAPPSEPDAAAPTPRRRAAPRKSAERKPAERKTPARPRKSAVARAEEAVGRAATTAKDAVVDAEQRAVRAVTPRSTKRAAPSRAAASRPTRSATAKASTRGRKAEDSGTTAKTTRKSAGNRSRKNDRSTLERATDRIGGKWGAALAGVAAAGLSAAAVLTLRGSSGKGVGTEKKPIDISGSGDKEKMHPQTVSTTGTHAHQPDGTDSSASFQAGIADENTVPDKV